MDLGKRNREYWSRYEAGTTPGIDVAPTPDLLESLPDGARVLDVGTGTGSLAESLASLGFSTSGIDINKNEITANTDRGSKVEYSTQDIAGTTGFHDAYFDLVLFRYTLTSIHKDQWKALIQEVDRITKPGGFVWLAEPYVNQAYTERYSLASHSLSDNHALYVFKNRDLAAQIKDAAALKEAIEHDEVARIVRHYDKNELLSLFPRFKKIDARHVNDTSPSGYPLDTIIMTLQKFSTAEMQLALQSKNPAT